MKAMNISSSNEMDLGILLAMNNLHLSRPKALELAMSRGLLGESFQTEGDNGSISGDNDPKRISNKIHLPEWMNRNKSQFLDSNVRWQNSELHFKKKHF